MNSKPIFPTPLHKAAAQLIQDYFVEIDSVDTVLVVNSCARGHAVPESDLDVAILVKPKTSPAAMKVIENQWQIYAETQPALAAYRSAHQFAHVHLDIIDGIYTPAFLEPGAPSDFFEVAIGNQVQYSAPMNSPGNYFRELQHKWLPYYNEDLRLQRFTMSKAACEYNLNHIEVYMERRLYFQAFDILYRAFQDYLQTLFIANKIYPIAYNKWIKEQVAVCLKRPALYPKLSPILSVNNLESGEIKIKAAMLYDLLYDITPEH